MESIERLISFLINFTVFAAFLFVTIKALQFHRHLKSKNELQRLQARVSQLRMALKAKVKKRANAFRIYFSKGIATGSDLDFQITHIIENRLEVSVDFQSYIDQVQKAFATVTAFPLPVETPYENFLRTDAEHELGIFKIIKELKDVSAKFNVKAESFRRMSVKNKVASLDPIRFPGLEEIEMKVHAAGLDERADASSIDLEKAS